MSWSRGHPSRGARRATFGTSSPVVGARACLNDLPRASTSACRCNRWNEWQGPRTLPHSLRQQRSSRISERVARAERPSAPCARTAAQNSPANGALLESGTSVRTLGFCGVDLHSESSSPLAGTPRLSRPRLDNHAVRSVARRGRGPSPRPPSPAPEVAPAPLGPARDRPRRAPFAQPDLRLARGCAGRLKSASRRLQLTGLHPSPPNIISQ